MKKVSIVHANPCGRRTTTVLQKHRVKALDGDWNALKQSPRRSVFPAHERNSPTQIVQKISGRLIDRTQGLDRDRLEVIVAYFASLREAAISVTQPGDQCKSQRWANDHVPRQGPAAFKTNQHDILRETVSWRLGVPSQLALWQLEPQQLRKLAQRDRSACDDLQGGLFADKAVQTASVDRQATSAKMGTHKSSPRCKPTASSLDSTGNLFRTMESLDHCLLTLVPPDRPLSNMLRTRGHDLEEPS